MNYIDVYKKKLKLNGSTASNEIKMATENIITQNFKYDPSYREATLKQKDLAERDIDIRLVNTNSPDEKKIYIIPNNIVQVGDYIEWIDENEKKTFLALGFEDNLISGCCYATKCNQTLKLKNGKNYPCIISNDSYGSKQNLSSDFLAEVDTKLKIQVQANNDTKNSCELDTRYMFNHSKYDIYKATDIQTAIIDGLIVMVSKKDKYLEGLDKLEDNYCFQGDSDNPQPPSPTDYVIEGEGTVKINKEYTYTVTPQEGDITFELDEYAVSENIVEMNTSDCSCTLKALKSDELITLSAVKDGQVVTSIDIDTVRY